MMGLLLGSSPFQCVCLSVVSFQPCILTEVQLSSEYWAKSHGKQHFLSFPSKLSTKPSVSATGSKSAFFFYCYAGWGYIMPLIKVLIIYQIYHTWIHPLHHSPLSPILGTVPTGIIFPFTNRLTQYLHYIHPPMPFPHLLPPPLVPPSSPRQDLFCPPSLRFFLKKKRDVLFI
jgi:hypothetical protein